MNKRGPLIAIGVAAGVIALVVVASSLSGGSGGTAADGPPIQQPASPFGDSPVEPGDVHAVGRERSSVPPERGGRQRDPCSASLREANQSRSNVFI